MTKTASNRYAKAIANITSARDLSATNKKRAQSLILLAADKRVFDALKSAQVSEKRFDARALYATEKCVKTVYSVTRDHVDLSKLNECAFVAIKTAILAHKHNSDLLKSDIESAILVNSKVSEKRKNIVFQKIAKIDATAQVQQVLDMLQTLNIVKRKAKDVYSVQENSMFEMMREKLADVSFAKA